MSDSTMESIKSGNGIQPLTKSSGTKDNPEPGIVSERNEAPSKNSGSYPKGKKD